MFDYAVCEIAGKQYLVKPEHEFLVGFLGDNTILECDKVILISEGGKLTLGSPYLKDRIKFEVVTQTNAKKIRVATYKSKSNYRKVIGSKRLLTKIKVAKSS